MQTLNHFISLSIHRESRLVKFFTYICDMFNMLRLLFGYSIYASCPSPNWLARLGIDNLSIANNQINDNCVQSGESRGVHSMSQNLWAYEHFYRRSFRYLIRYFRVGPNIRGSTGQGQGHKSDVWYRPQILPSDKRRCWVSEWVSVTGVWN